MKRVFLAVTLLWVLFSSALVAPTRAGTTADGFARGNALYAAGDFAGAAQAYETQARQGALTANLFFNLGDAYYRQGRRGKAILNYQRALILEPTHAEAAANLAFVRGQKAAASPRSGWVEDVLPWVTAAAGWLAVVGLAMAVWGPRWRVPGLALTVAGVLGCAGGLLTIRALGDDTRDTARAVVVADDAPARYAPADNAKIITTLTAGGEVRILSDQGAWDYTLLSDGTRAWVASNRIERLVPR